MTARDWQPTTSGGSPSRGRRRSRKATDTLGGLNGWAITKKASPAAVDFLKYLTSPEQERKMAAAGMIIPAALGAEDSLKNPLMRQAADQLAGSTWHRTSSTRISALPSGAWSTMSRWKPLRQYVAKGWRTDDPGCARAGIAPLRNKNRRQDWRFLRDGFERRRRHDGY